MCVLLSSSWATRKTIRDRKWEGISSTFSVLTFTETSSGIPLCTTDDPHKFSSSFICMCQCVPAWASSWFRRSVWFRVKRVCVCVCVCECVFECSVQLGSVLTCLFFLFSITVVSRTFDRTLNPFHQNCSFSVLCNCPVLQIYVQYLYVNTLYPFFHLSLYFFISDMCWNDFLRIFFNLPCLFALCLWR